MNLINFGKAVEKWQQRFGLEPISLLEQRTYINKQRQALEQQIKTRDFFSNIFCLSQWEDRKSDPYISATLDILYKISEFDRFINELMHLLFTYKVPCYLSDPTENYNYKPFPHLIFFQNRTEIIESIGYIDIGTKTYLICFEETMFDLFLRDVEKSYKNIKTDILNRGEHAPEVRAFKKALIELTDEDIQLLHTQGDENNNKKTELAHRLQTWEPTLNDRWALNLSVLLGKIVKD